MKFQRLKTMRFRGGVLAVILLGSAMLAQAQYDTPQLRPGAPNPFTPTNNPWNRDAAFTPGGGSVILTNWRGTNPPLITVGHTRQNRIGSGIVPLNSQYGVGDTLYPPEDALLLFGDGWVPVIGTNGNPNAVQWLRYANTNLFIAVDEGVANVSWTNALTTNRFSSTYVIGPNLTRRPVRLFQHALPHHLIQPLLRGHPRRQARFINLLRRPLPRRFPGHQQ